MSLRKLPEIMAFERPAGWQWDAPSTALERWSNGPMAAAGEDASTITIFDIIGEDYWSGGGFTTKRMSAALRAIGPKAVTVEINSPGGDMFEGLAIYNLLRDHPAEVTVKIMGIAASAASVIAMAGDVVTMGRGSFLMIHNCWGVVIGDQQDMRAAAETMAPFDAAMSGIYAARTGLAEKSIAKMMDAETYINASDAVAQKFADGLMEDAPASASAQAKSGSIAARRRLDSVLARQGMPRSERRRLMGEITGTQDAAGTATHDAGFHAAALQLLTTIRS